jgi:superfamily II DNA/RNA helicase
LGADLTIVQAIQFRVVRNQEIATLLQRWGRASRHGQPGFAVLLLDEWMKSVRKNPAVMRRHQLEGSVEQNPVAEESEDEDIEGEGRALPMAKRKSMDSQILSGATSCQRSGTEWPTLQMALISFES